MRSLVWNINMVAHKKIALLQQLAPDLAIVPECAAPAVIVAKCPEFIFTDAQWQQRSRHKGLGVFSFGDVRFTRARVFDPQYEVFLPLSVTGPRSAPDLSPRRRIAEATRKPGDGSSIDPSSSIEGVQSGLCTCHVLLNASPADTDPTHDCVPCFNW